MQKVVKSSLILSGVLFSLFLSGCSETPLDSLKKDQPSVNYPESFWEKEQKANTDLWQQAVKICKDENYKDNPNCAGIHDIQMFDHPLPFPKYGSGQGFGKGNMPDVSNPKHKSE